jgi:hypothetical protein
MNVLPIEKQIQIINSLVEGCSVHSTARLVGVGHKTVLRVLLRVGKRCQRLLDEKMRNLPTRRLRFKRRTTLFIQFRPYWKCKELSAESKHLLSI